MSEDIEYGVHAYWIQWLTTPARDRLRAALRIHARLEDCEVARLSLKFFTDGEPTEWPFGVRIEGRFHCHGHGATLVDALQDLLANLQGWRDREVMEIRARIAQRDKAADEARATLARLEKAWPL